MITELMMQDSPKPAEPTKTVDGFFGPKQVTRAQFIQRWASHYAEFYHLCDTTADYDELVKIGKRMQELASAKWDRIK